MSKLSFIHPLDQPLGKRRLLGDLKKALRDPSFVNFRLIVAYAKSGPLLRLEELLEKWRAAGKTSAAIIGVDQQGTSREALELALTLFDSVYVAREAGLTFHPKLYLFTGSKRADAFIGSNNLTVGGTEKNFEASIHVQFDLPEDASDLTSLELAWTQLLPSSCPATTKLNAKVLAQLVAADVVVDESKSRSGLGSGDNASVGRASRAPRSGLAIKPESPLPKKMPPSASSGRAGKATPAVRSIESARGFVIQIKPHHNGEIFLSKTAALQNPSFFGWPFTGTTTPKKSSNVSYPQLTPDPIVNIVVFGAGTEPVLTLSSYPLNTVYYEKKSEIRITASPLVSQVPDYSVMIMERSDILGVSYDITIHRPDSSEYAAWVAACNQTMPSGGRTPRKYGWF